jgi:predicted transcriptional regulator
MTQELPMQPEEVENAVRASKIDMLEALLELEGKDTLTIPKEEEIHNTRYLSEQELDNLEWARDFLSRYERKLKK